MDKATKKNIWVFTHIYVYIWNELKYCTFVYELGLVYSRLYEMGWVVSTWNGWREKMLMTETGTASEGEVVCVCVFLWVE